MKIDKRPATNDLGADVRLPGTSSGLRYEAIGALVVVLACFVLFRNAVLLRGVFFHYDHAQQNYPYRWFFAEGLKAGELRLWTKDLFCGFPLFAEGQGNAAYPPFLALFLTLPSWVAYNYYVVLHFLLAGLGTYALGRLLRIGRAGAALAGITYMLSGPVLFHAHHVNIIVATAWLPVLLVMMELSLRRGSLPPLLGFAGATAALILGAQPQYTLYCGLACGLWLIWRMWLRFIAHDKAYRFTPVAAGFAATAVLALVLSAVQLMPTAELVARSSRGVGRTGYSIAPGCPANLMTILLPHYFGTSGQGSYWGTTGNGLHSELTLYCGVVPLMLALVGAMLNRRRSTVFLVALGLFAFLFSLGYYGPIYGFFGAMPLLRETRFPQRFAFVTALCVGLLAGVGLHALMHAEDRLRARRAVLTALTVIATGAVVCIAVASVCNRELAGLSFASLHERLPKVLDPYVKVIWNHLHTTLPADVARLTGVVLAGAGLLTLTLSRSRSRTLITHHSSLITASLWCILVFVEMASVGWDFTPVTDPKIYNTPPALAQRLHDEIGEDNARFMRISARNLFDARRDPPGHPATQGWAIGPERYIYCLDGVPRNVNMLWDLPSIDGFCPLQTTRLKEMLGRPKKRGTIVYFPLQPAMNLLGARAIVTSPEIVLPDTYAHFEDLGLHGQMHLYRNPDALPAAFIVHRARGVASADEQAALEELRAPGFDFRELVLLNDVRVADTWAVQDGLQEPGESVHIEEYDHGRVRLQATLTRPGFLILTEQHYPGWRVRVDGRPVDLLRADHMVMAIRLEAGTHEVEFAFRPASFRRGAALTVIGLLLVAAMAVLAWRRHRLAQIWPPESEPLIDAPCRSSTLYNILALAALLMLLGVAVQWGRWSNMPTQLTPSGLARFWR